MNLCDGGLAGQPLNAHNTAGDFEEVWLVLISRKRGVNIRGFFAEEFYELVISAACFAPAEVGIQMRAFVMKPMWETHGSCYLSATLQVAGYLCPCGLASGKLCMCVYKRSFHIP